MPRRLTAKELVSRPQALEQLALTALHRDLIKKRIEHMADELAPALKGLYVTFVTLGYGAKYFDARFTAQKPFEGFRTRALFIRATGYNGTTPAELYHDAHSIQDLATKYERTGAFVLLDEVRHTGQSMYKMKRFFGERFPKARVVSVCLIDRPDCVSAPYNEPLDLTGFRIWQRGAGRLDRERGQRQGWLVGFGMDVLDSFRPLKTVRWTMVKPDPDGNCEQDEFIKPEPDESPIIRVPASHAHEHPLEEWEKLYFKKKAEPRAR